MPHGRFQMKFALQRPTLRMCAFLLGLWATAATAQLPMRPPAFVGGVPGMAQMQSIVLQRHQARTLLYREALEILKKNPAAADVPECPQGKPAADALCIRATDTVAVALPVQPPASAPVVQVAPAPEKMVPAVPAVPARKIAVLFGNNAYPAPIPALETPIADVQDIGRILQERFGYEVRVLPNARKADVVNALNQVGAETRPGDSVLVFYAGHGYLVDSTHMGYWIPVDGSTKSPANWVSNTDISKFLKNMGAQQVLLISDSCFSGSLTREQKISTALRSKDAGQILSKRSVLVMSSGGEEPVSDEGKDGHSIFAWSLLQALASAGTLTPGAEMFNVVKREVVKGYAQQPQYGAVLAAGHMEGGEYLFETVVKK